jgi:RNA-directed DNA polymerase
MSAAMSARSVRQAEGLDSVRALQRVLYRSAKQDPGRRFHALFDKVARSDVMVRAWNDVAANRGAPGVDGVSITDIKAGGPESVRVFLDELAGRLRSTSYRPRRCGGYVFRNRAGGASTARSVSPRWPTGW